MSEGLTDLDSRFENVMAGLAPFETAPVLAVAVSGGGDSLALCLLAHRWARRRGGQAVGLTVDHGLRPEAADEARQVGLWLAAAGIRHHILTVAAPPPQASIQDWARRQRYALLRQWCAGTGTLHLLLAHHAGDQAETVLLRLARGSGVHGLSGMALQHCDADCRILRPLLGIPKHSLEEWLGSRAQPWIDDPSNESRRFARVRMRGLMPDLAAEGISESRLGETARVLGRTREGVDRAVSRLLGQTTWVSRLGVACIEDPTRWTTADPDVALRALAAVLSCIGGADYPPRAERLERALRIWGQPCTLGGCRVRPVGSRVWIQREARGLPVVPLGYGQRTVWDSRFEIICPEQLDLASRETAASPAFTVRALGAEGVSILQRLPGFDGRAEEAKSPGLSCALPTLPALWSERILVSVPHLGYVMSGVFASGDPVARFCPKHPVDAWGLRR